MHIETLLAHSGCLEDLETGALVAPIHLSTTYHRDGDGSYPKGFMYSRHENPTRNLFEQTMANIEGGATASSFSSGMAAIQTVFQALPPNSQVLLPDDIYHGVSKMARSLFANWGISFQEVDMSSLEEINEHIQENTKLIWLESPSNPMLKISDIGAIAELAKSRNIIVAVDGTWTTPLLQKPLELGADLVIHSITKYIAGHSDVLGGVIISKEKNSFSDRIQEIQRTCGAVLDPFSAWLTMRGMRSLSPRLHAQCKNAEQVAHFLNNHPSVNIVHYPGLPNHRGYDIAKRQMSKFGAMLSFEVKGDAQRALTTAANTVVFQRATSLGGTESLIEHRASIEPEYSQTPENLLRLSMGLENIDDLLHDLNKALSA